MAAFVSTTIISPSSAQDYTGAPNCFATAGSSIAGPNVRPSLPTTISLGVILVKFTDRTNYAGGNRPNGYLKSDFEDMLFSDDFFISDEPHEQFTPDGEDVFGSLRDWYQENSPVVHPVFWTQKRPLLRNFDCGFVLVVPLGFEFDWSQIA